MHRLFIGLRPPRAIREALLALMGGVPGARWQDDEQLHCTLRFIGEVDSRTGDDIAAALAQLRFRPLEVALCGVGSFATRGRPNALWAGLRPHDRLADMHRKIDQALVRIGLEPEHRAYLPHITIARLNSQSAPVDRFLADHAGLTSAPFGFSHITLFESHIGHGGARYEVAARYPIG